MRGKRACPTSLHQTRPSTSWVMSGLSSFLPITTLLRIALTARSVQEIRSCTTNDNNQTSYKVSVSPQHEEGEKLTCYPRDSMEMPPDTLEDVGVNELFVTVTVDVSFTTEQAVVGHLDEIDILITVRTATIVGYLSPHRSVTPAPC
jgi:hypothetical protein